jgi:hypothetical protein
MTIAWTNSGPQLHELHLQSFEADKNVQLPAEYREFLLSHNGGEPKPHWFILHTTEERETWLWVTELKQIGVPSNDYRSLYYWPDYYDEGIPSDCIVIGNGMSLDVFVLYVRGARARQVWYKSFVNCDEESNSDDELYFLAESFPAFLAMLKTRPQNS